MKKTLAILLIMTLFMSGCSTHSASENTPDGDVRADETVGYEATAFDEDAFKEAVVSSYKKMGIDAVILSNMAAYENNYWKSLESVGGRMNSEKMLASADEWLAENADCGLDDLESNFQDISNDYKEILLMNAEGEFAEKIMEQYDTFFKTYVTLYGLTTSPSGSRADFSSQVNECLGTLEDATRIIGALLGE